MERSNNPIDFLKQFIALLEREKEALIHNEGATIQSIVAEKHVFIEWFPTFNFQQEADNEVEALVDTIRHLQETNLLLTKQALDYQEAVMEALSKGVKKAGKTYSKSGQQTGLTQASILNQSL